MLKRHAHAVQRDPALVHGVLAVHRASHAVELALDRGPASLLDSAGGAAVREQEVDVDRVFDAATVHAVLRLLHHGRVRRELHKHHGRGCGEVYPHAARGDAHQRHAAARVVAEPVHGFAALRRRRRAFQADEALHRPHVRVGAVSGRGKAHVRGGPARGDAGQAVQDLVRDTVHDVLVVREDDHLGRRRRLLRLRRVPVGGGARLRCAVLHEEHLLEPLDRAGQLHERGVAMARHRRASRRASRCLLQRALGASARSTLKRALVVALAARLAARLARLARLAVAVAVAAPSRCVDGHHLPPLRG